jgi:hypothetical protein
MERWIHVVFGAALLSLVACGGHSAPESGRNSGAPSLQVGGSAPPAPRAAPTIARCLLGRVHASDGGTRPTPIPAADLSLFVIGLNHNDEPHVHLGQQGVDGVAAALAADATLDPAKLVVALSANDSTQLEGGACNAGAFVGADGIATNGECLAAALQRALGPRLPPGTKFSYWDVTSIGRSADGGHAVITGPRWIGAPVRTTPSAAPAIYEGASSTVVTLQDANDRSSVFSLYVVHTRGAYADRGHEEEERGGTAPALEDLDVVARDALERVQSHEVAPIIAGDFNSGPSSCQKLPFHPDEDQSGCPTFEKYFRNRFSWADKGVTCPPQGGRPEVDLTMEGQIMHVLVASTGVAPSYFQRGFSPVAVRYSANPDGSAFSSIDGIRLVPEFGHNGHNIVGMDFVKVKGPCPDGQASCGVACVDEMRDRANCGACGHACGSQEHCSNGACFANKPIHTCDDPTKQSWCDCTGTCVDKGSNFCKHPC